MLRNKSLTQLSIGNNLMLFLGQKKHGIVVDPLNFEFLYFSALMYLIVVTHTFKCTHIFLAFVVRFEILNNLKIFFNKFSFSIWNLL